MLDKCNCGPFKFNGVLVHTKECPANAERPAETPAKVPITAEQLVRMLRAEAAACISGVAILLSKEAQEGFKLMELKLTAAADMIEAQEKRFAEHLEAWKANNAHHAARITELEADEKRLQWLEDNHTLHTGVEMLYVVDGYQLTMMRDGNEGHCYYGASMREAVDNAMKHETKK